MGHETAQRIVQSLDTASGIMEPKVGRWCAWPVVKPGLFFQLLKQDSSLSASVSEGAKFAGHLRKILKMTPSVFFGCLQLLRHARWRTDPQSVFYAFSSNRSEKQKDGKYKDIFYDDLLISGKLRWKPFIIETPVNWGHLKPVVGPRHVFDEPMILLSGIIASLPSVQLAIQSATDHLVTIFLNNGVPLIRSVLESLVRNRLMVFEAGRRVYSLLLKHRNSKTLIVLDADAVTGIIAAAKRNLHPGL